MIERRRKVGAIFSVSLAKGPEYLLLRLWILKKIKKNSQSAGATQ